METFVSLLLNIVYGFLFFVGFGVMILTVITFARAFWDIMGRELGRKE